MWPFKKKKKAPKAGGISEERIRAITAASLKGQFGSWRPNYETLLGELRQGNLALVRKRCRESSVNSPAIASLIAELKSLAIGAGITVEFKHKTERHADKANQLWNEWTESKNFSADGELNFKRMQKLVMDEIATVGEIFIKKNLVNSDSPGANVPIDYQLIPADCITRFLGCATCW